MFKRVTLVVLLAAALLVAACQPTPPAAPTQPAATQVEAQLPAVTEAPAPTVAPPTPAPAAPSILRVGWAGSPDTLNPGTGLLTESYTIYGLVYDSMYNYQLDGTYSLRLAESVDVSEDGKVWTFTLRPGLTFHDGAPLTADDVVFSYNLYAATEDFPYMPGYTTYFESVEAKSPSEVVITLTQPIPNMESQLYYLFVLPKHIWEGVENVAEFENLEMIGSGPFKLAEYSQGEFVRLEAVQEHFYAPRVDQLIFQTFENQDALVQAIRTGQVDMITEMPNTAVAALRQADNVQVVTGPPLAPDITDIIINHANPETCPTEEGGVCSGNPALRDLKFRQALAHATDKQRLIDIVLLGLGDPGLTLVANSLTQFYNDQIQDYAYDPAKAKQLLDEAGYQDTDGDGLRELPTGGAINLRMNYPSDSTTAPRESELLKEMWGEVGIGVEIQPLDPDTLTSVCCPAFDYDIILWGWGSDPDPSFLLSVHLSSEVSTGLSETGYANPEFDALYDQQTVALDLEKRRQIIFQMQEILHRDVVYIVPWYAQAVQAYRTDTFTGWLTKEPKVALEDVSSMILVEPVK
jgi:peptide/nickel transport system substrate-binding protein